MNCPKCGAEMILRTARRGRNRGSQFYGCSNYPNCRETLDAVNVQAAVNNNPNDRTVLNAQEPNYINIPHTLYARPKYHEYQVKFYETIGLPNKFVQKLNREIEFKELFGKNNKWRIDYPLNSFYNLSSAESLVYQVALKILTRGKNTIVSPFVEKSLVDYLFINLNDEMEISDNSILFNHIQNTNSTFLWFDGPAIEKKFYSELLPKFLGRNYRKFVIPQISPSSLVNDSNLVSGNQRVDFLLNFNEEKIIVELDGEDHLAHQSADDQRDEKLETVGYKIIRIKNNEVENEIGPNLEKLIEIIEKNKFTDYTEYSCTDKLIISTKLIHQIEITILEAIQNGFIDISLPINILIDENSINLDSNLISKIVKITETDLNQILEHISILYCDSIPRINISLLDSKCENLIIISFNDNCNGTAPKFIIQDISLPFQIAKYNKPIGNITDININRESLLYFLKYIFHHEEFLEGQFEAISKALSGEDAIVLLPTGAGKSVAFQLASLILPGITIVIDPIVALIDDQIDNLNRSGIDSVVGITSQISDPELKSKIIQSFGQGEYNFCYVAPERFQTSEFRKTLESLTISTPISLIVIDEAHCVSEWGHNFRTSYLNIGRTSRKYATARNFTPPLLALTGTASNSVLRDIQRELGILEYDSIITPKTFNRKELHFNIFESPSAEKLRILKAVLQRILPEKYNTTFTTFYDMLDDNTNSGILFCPHVGGSFGIVDNSTAINTNLGLNTKYYSGTIPNNWNNNIDWNNYKKKTAKDFKENRFPLLIATNAFGMGIDKPNIRYVIHYGLPQSIEAFYQEVGRAGRDRKNAQSFVILSNDIPDRSTRLLDPGSSIEEVKKIIETERTWDNDDDITRALFFHTNSFKGIFDELNDVKTVINSIKPLDKQRELSFVFRGLKRNSAEKSIHRLVILGVIEDYIINYSNNEFTLILSGIAIDEIVENYIRYVSGYNKGRVRIERKKILQNADMDLETFIIASIKILLEFIYDTVEKGRRRALREMLTLSQKALVCDKEEVDEFIRNGILNYLESSYSEELEEVLNNAGNLKLIIRLIEGETLAETGELDGGIRSTNDALELRGQVARYLESYPDHPGLLALRALVELFLNNFDKNIFYENFYASIKYGKDRYSISSKELGEFVIWVCTFIYSIDTIFFDEFIEDYNQHYNSLPLCRALIFHESTELSMIYKPALYVFSSYATRIKNLISEGRNVR